MPTEFYFALTAIAVQGYNAIFSDYTVKERLSSSSDQRLIFVFSVLKVIAFSDYNRKICSKMITSIIRYHTAIYYIMSITRDRFRPYWVSSGGCRIHSIINMQKKQICHWVQKNAIQNNMIQQYLYHGVTFKDTHT